MVKTTANTDGGVDISIKESGTKCLLDILGLQQEIVTLLTAKGIDAKPHDRFLTRLVSKVEACYCSCDDECDEDYN
jgi:hypothetical protein